jgi:hypothetical protein
MGEAPASNRKVPGGAPSAEETQPSGWPGATTTVRVFPRQAEVIRKTEARDSERGLRDLIGLLISGEIRGLMLSW